jgi:hypothetical protein
MTNFTNITQANDWYEIILGLDTLFPTQFQGVLGIAIAIMVFAVAFISMKSLKFETASCFASAMFITLVVSVLTTTMGLMSLEALLPIILIFAVSVVMLFREGT